MVDIWNWITVFVTYLYDDHSHGSRPRHRTSLGLFYHLDRVIEEHSSTYFLALFIYKFSRINVKVVSEIWTLISITSYISVRLVNWILTLLRLCPRLGFVFIEFWVSSIHLGSRLVAVFADRYHNILHGNKSMTHLHTSGGPHIIIWFSIQSSTISTTHPNDLIQW